MPTKVTQADAVFQSMQRNGGFAKLGQLYVAALQVQGSRWGTKTPFASIRRIVQEDPRFFKIRPGLWALESERNQVLASFQLPQDAPEKPIEAFDHSYYQGLLLELGNLRSYQTYVPPQDKNRKYLDKKLSDVATLEQFHRFTFDEVLNDGRTVDVVWFNSRRFPHAFYEVEHSTDIYNSLRKFVTFQDFRTEFYIVAPAARCAEYEDKVNRTAYATVRERVCFINYDRLENLYSAEMEVAARRIAAGL